MRNIRNVYKKPTSKLQTQTKMGNQKVFLIVIMISAMIMSNMEVNLATPNPPSGPNTGTSDPPPPPPHFHSNDRVKPSSEDKSWISRYLSFW